MENDDADNPIALDYTACQNEVKKGVAKPLHLHTTGCYDALTDWLVENASILIGIGAGVVFVEVSFIPKSGWGKT